MKVSMRWGMWVSLMLATTIAGCGTSKQEEKAAADAQKKASNNWIWSAVRIGFRV